MDLIYADASRKDIGVINSYDLDMAYGKSENDFTCSVGRSDHCCSKGYFIYVEGTEYGGTVDGIKVDTEDDAVTYSGRTWHGILESKVICPDTGDNYLIVSGEANEVLQEIFERIGLTGLFTASSENSGVMIKNYQFNRYCYAYSGVRKMLKDHSLKLAIKWHNGMIVASAEPVHDYSQDDEFDASQVEFTIEKNFRPVNHLVCLGQGDLKDRAVIHLFADENGGVQPYLVNPDADPVEDADYILNTSQQVLTGQDEIVEVYDVSNAEITTNYVQLSEQPADWEENCTAYYYYEPETKVEDGETLDTGGNYKNVQMLDVGYVLQTAQPADWAEGYGKYFTYDSGTNQYIAVAGTDIYDLLTSQPGNWTKGYSAYYRQSGDAYIAVTRVVATDYIKQKAQPDDWTLNYGKYYIRYTDGVTVDYRPVTGTASYTYEMQTVEPTDWHTSFGSYFRRATDRELKQDKSTQWYQVSLTAKGQVPAWQAKTYYTKLTRQEAPAWGDEDRYTRTDSTAAPAWEAGTYYQKKGGTAPAWTEQTYYTKTGLKIPPEWIEGKFFRQAVDRFAAMVAEGIERLGDFYADDKLNINLSETDRVYDVGDIVGSREDVTGVETVQEVTKKIIRINNNDIDIRYEVD